MPFSQMGCSKGEEMTEDFPAYQTFYFHPNIIDQKHRVACASCQFAASGMILFVDIFKDQEKKTYDE